MMYDYKKWQYNAAERQATMDEATKVRSAQFWPKKILVRQAYESTESTLEQKCVQFEDGQVVYLCARASNWLVPYCL